MKAGKYSYKELFVNRYVSQLVVPEIQRDYVWQKEQLEGFLNTLCDDYMKYSTEVVPEVMADIDSNESAQLQKDFSEFYRKRNFSANIGFIYAYSDEQYSGRYFLIDGQQRITTLYLLILVLASRTEQVSDFKKNYCNKLQPILDYRVRDSAQQFLHQLVPYVLDNSTRGIKQQSWYLNSYNYDVTITNMLQNMGDIINWLDHQAENAEFVFDDLSFYNYIQNYTEFWYFDTNISAQGENLYIYLNARGEQMQGNENLKAELLGRLSSDNEKNIWGRKWEEWQDYFWQKRRAGKAYKGRVGNPNADKGFNEFLVCVSALSQYLKNDTSLFLDKDRNVSPLVLSNILSLDVIEQYIKALQFLDDNKMQFCGNYTYAAWVGECIDELWKLLNYTNTAWFVDYSDSRFSTETNHMVFMWGVLHWLSSAELHSDSISVESVFRGVRQFYLRFHNNIRSVRAISSSIDSLLKSGFVSNDEMSEEYIRERWLAKQSANRNELESLIWEIEDHPYNLDGSDVGLINISHLVDFDDELSVNDLKEIKESFFDCFPSDDKSHKPIQSLLLYYGEFWQRKSPRYYKNYQFNDWRKIIRHRQVENGDYFFRLLLDELIEAGLSHEELLKERRKNNPAPDNPVSLREELLWYNHYLGEKMWAQGNYIAIQVGAEGNEVDKVFPSRAIFYNTKGDFRGGSPTPLSSLLPKEILDSVISKSANG